MKVLVVDSATNPNMAAVFELSMELVLDPGIEVRFSKRSEDAVDCVESFLPSAIILTGEPSGAEGWQLIDALRGRVPGAVMAYLDDDQLHILGGTPREPGVGRSDRPRAIPATSFRDLAAAVTFAAAEFA